MFKIGDFSRLTRVTVKALRHCDDLGLLKPAHFDAFTGYRYYSATHGTVQPRELPAVEMMACTIHRGTPTTIEAARAALLSWIEGNGYDIDGPERALSLQRGGEDEEMVTEIQLPIKKVT